MIVRVPDHSRQALDGVRVIDFGQYIAGPLAAMILADNGADVVRVDPPGGPRWHHPANAMLQRGKRSVVLDLGNAGDREFASDLVERSDVLIEGFRPGVMARLGLGPIDLANRNPRLVYASLPGFAAGDDRQGVRAWESIVAAAAGMHSPGPRVRGDGSLGPATDGEPEPLELPTPSVMAAINATNAIVAALIARECSGSGQIIEAPLFDAALEVLNFEGQSPKGPGPMRLGPTIEAECGDGRWIQVLLTTPRHLRRFVAAFLAPEDAAAFGPEQVIGDAMLTDQLRAHVRGLLATAPANDWDARINAIGVPASMLLSAAEWVRDDQASATKAVIELDDPLLGPMRQPGYAFGLSATPPRSRHGRRPLDADRAAVLDVLSQPALAPSGSAVSPRPCLPLDGVRVIDTSVVLAGPTAGRVLAAFGADVVKVNQPGYWIGFWLHANGGKRSALVDLQAASGRAVLADLVSGADVVVTNLSNDALERLGLDEPSVRKLAPDVVHLAISAYGACGPRRSFRGFEHVAQTRTGITFRRGKGRSVPIRFPLSDCASGHLGAMGVLMALFHRSRGGRGQAVTTSLAHAATFQQAPLLVSPCDDTHDSSPTADEPPVHLHRCADGRWVCVVGNDTAVLAVARQQLAAADVDLPSAMAKRRCQDWLEAFDAAGLAAHAVEDVATVFASSQARARGVVTEHVRAAYGTVVTVGATVHMSGTPPRRLAPPDPPGSATREVLRELGREADVDGLVAVGVVADELGEPGQLSW